MDVLYFSSEFCDDMNFFLELWFYIWGLVGDEFSSNFNKREGHFDEGAYLCEGSTGDDIELFSILWIVGECFCSGMDGLYIGEFEVLSDVLNDVEFFLYGIEPDELGIGGGDS